MIRIQIRPVWRFRGEDSERDFDFQLVSILAGLESSGKLTHAAEAAGLSYRHAWNLVSEWEAFFGARLVEKSKGRGSVLTALGKRLLWAGQRAQMRLAPELENLAGDFAGALNEALEERPAALAMHASHDFAIVMLRDLLADGDYPMALQYKGSFAALASVAAEVPAETIPPDRIGQDVDLTDLRTWWGAPRAAFLCDRRSGKQFLTAVRTCWPPSTSWPAPTPTSGRPARPSSRPSA